MLTITKQKSTNKRIMVIDAMRCITLIGMLCTGYTILQIWISHYLLKKFRYGPIEWVWRFGTYLKWQPLIRLRPDDTNSLNINPRTL